MLHGSRFGTNSRDPKIEVPVVKNKLCECETQLVVTNFKEYAVLISKTRIFPKGSRGLRNVAVVNRRLVLSQFFCCGQRSGGVPSRFVGNRTFFELKRAER